MLIRDDFHWDDYFWNTSVLLSSMTGPQSCLGPYAPNHEALQSESEIVLIDEEKVEYMPDIDSVDDIRPMIGLRSAFIHKFAKDNLPYIGIEFKCLWDDEHMAGVMLNGSRVVEAGAGDTASLDWIAERDLKGTED